MIYLSTPHSFPIQTKKTQSIDKDIRILVDLNPGTSFHGLIQERFVDKLEEAGLSYSSLRSSAVHYAELATGKADLVLECTRKGNLEIAAAYGIIKNAGGAIITYDGEELGDKKYWSFAQKDNVCVIGAATPRLAKSACEFFNR